MSRYVSRKLPICYHYQYNIYIHNTYLIIIAMVGVGEASYLPWTHTDHTTPCRCSSSFGNCLSSALPRDMRQQSHSNPKSKQKASTPINAASPRTQPKMLYSHSYDPATGTLNPKPLNPAWNLVQLLDVVLRRPRFSEHLLKVPRLDEDLGVEPNLVNIGT